MKKPVWKRNTKGVLPSDLSDYVLFSGCTHVSHINKKLMKDSDFSISHVFDIEYYKSTERREAKR